MSYNSIEVRLERLRRLRNQNLPKEFNRKAKYYNNEIVRKCYQFTTDKKLLQQRFLVQKQFYQHFNGEMPSIRVIGRIVKYKPFSARLGNYLGQIRRRREELLKARDELIRTKTENLDRTFEKTSFKTEDLSNKWFTFQKPQKL